MSVAIARPQTRQANHRWVAGSDAYQAQFQSKRQLSRLNQTFGLRLGLASACRPARWMPRLPDWLLARSESTPAMQPEPVRRRPTQGPDESQAQQFEPVGLLAVQRNGVGCKPVSQAQDLVDLVQMVLPIVAQ